MFVLMYCSSKTIWLCMLHMIVTRHGELVKIVTVEKMYTSGKHCGHFQLSVHT